MTAAPTQRLPALDWARGFIMVLMALDHVVAFVYRYHPQEVWGGAWTRYAAWPPFVTRFVTHLCAPGFFLLMGAGVALFLSARQQAGWPVARARSFLLVRGGLLLVINQLIENRAWSWGFASSQVPPAAIPTDPWPGQPGPLVFVFSVLTGLGMSLCLAALLLSLRKRWLALVGTAFLLASAVFTPSPDHARDTYNVFLRLLFLPGQTDVFLVLYPLCPWAGLTLWGLVLGRLLHEKPQATFSALPLVGLGLVVVALGLRATGGFGNLRLPRDGGAIEFLNLIKYPPSLAFVLLFGGTNLLLLSLWNRIGARLGGWGVVLATFGQVPLFYYLSHLFLYCAVGAVAFRKGGSLSVTYLVWVAGLVPLYFLSAAYRRFKSRTSPDSLWRFL